MAVFHVNPTVGLPLWKQGIVRIRNRLNVILSGWEQRYAFAISWEQGIILSAVTTIGRIPDYYFQAVGSGTGAIAAWEANMRLIEDGRFGSNTIHGRSGQTRT